MNIQILVFCVLLFSFNTPIIADTGFLKISSEPNGAKVYLDNHFLGETPYQSYDIKEGEHVIHLTYNDESNLIYPEELRNITIDDLNPKQIHIKFNVIDCDNKGIFKSYKTPYSIYCDNGNIKILSKPLWAEVFISGKKINKAPFKADNIKVGKYDIEFRLNGKIIVTSFDILKNITVKLTADFEQNKIINSYLEKQKYLKSERSKYINNSDGTVTDIKTGLMWMSCSIGQTQANKTCTGRANKYEWEEARNLSVNFASFNDWRLPTIQELNTLIYCSNNRIIEYERDGYYEKWGRTGGFGCGINSRNINDETFNFQYPTINQAVFPNTPPYGFWSNSIEDESYTSSNWQEDAWYVDFKYGSEGRTFLDSANHVRLVRSIKNK